MVSGQGFQFSGKFMVNSYTGNAMVDCHITVHYQSQNVEIDVVNATRSSQISKIAYVLLLLSMVQIHILEFRKMVEELVFPI